MNSAFSGVAFVGAATASVNHFYRDVTFPAGEPVINLSFKYKVSVADPGFDRLRVYLIPTATTPVAGTELAVAGNNQITSNLERALTYETVNISIPPSAAGTTQRLVFSWRTDSVSPLAAVSVDEISLTTAASTPLSGMKTIDNTLPTAGSNYASFTDAINALNTSGVFGGGGVTFVVTAGQTFVEDPPAIISQTSSMADYVIFQSSGLGANPVVRPTGGAGLNDFGLAISGPDYVTFDGIDVAIASGSAVEFGYLVRNASSMDGASNNTIRNASVTLNRANTASIGILQSSVETTAAGSGAGVPATGGPGGGNQFNHYYNVSVQNSYKGIYLSATSLWTPSGGDTDNEIGVIGIGGKTVIGGPTANDIGGGTTATQTWGIRATAQRNVKIFQTEVRNVSANTTTDGIYLDQTVGLSEVSRNVVHDIRNNSTTSTTGINGIRSNHFNNASFTGIVNTVKNNFVYNITSAHTGSATATRTLKGIYLQSSGGGFVTNFHDIHNNTVLIDGSGSPNLSSVCFEHGTTSGPVYNVRNNIFANTTGAQTGAAVHFTWKSTATASIGNTGSVSDFNDLYIANATNGFVGQGSSTNYATLANWQTAMVGQDVNSISADPLFASATNLHIFPTSPARNTGTTIGAVADDIDGESRPGAIAPEGADYDIGADEFYATLGTVEYSATSFTTLEGTVATITVNRVGGFSGPLSINYATGGGTASGGAACGAGVDYVTTSGTLMWADLDAAPKTFMVQTCGDAVVDNEFVNLTLSEVPPLTTIISGTNPVPLNITDNPPGTVQFSSTTFTGVEGTMATITATRTGGSGGALTVDFATSDGTAFGGAACTTGIDFINASGTLTWADLDAANKTFDVTLCTEGDAEGTQTAGLTLSNVSAGGTIGANNPATLNITDDTFGTPTQFCSTDGPLMIPNPSPSPVPANSAGLPYPSTVTVSGMTGVITNVTVTMNNFQHTFATDIDLLLVGPGGQKFILMSDASSSSGLDTAVTFTFADNGVALPTSGNITPGTYLPNDTTAGDTFAAPAPAGPYVSPGPVGAGTLNGTFGGTDPNGTWQLYSMDDAGGDLGTLDSWCLNISTSDATPPSAVITSNPPDPSISGNATFTFSGSDMIAPEAIARFECSLDMAAFTTCTSPKSYTGLAAGVHNFRVRAIDNSNNVGAPASYDWLVDPPPGCVIPPSGMAAWWAGEGNLFDRTANANNGVNSGVTFTPFGKVFSAMTFNGTSGFFNAPASTSLDVSGAGAHPTTPGISVDAWFKPGGFAGQQPIVEWNNPAAMPGDEIGVHFWHSVTFSGAMGPADLYVNIVDTLGTNHIVYTNPNILTAGVYSHVAFTYDQASGDVRIFVDGAPVAVGANGGPVGPGTTANIGTGITPRTDRALYVGHRPTNGLEYLNGTLDEIEIFNRALTATEVDNIFDADTTGKCTGTIEFSSPTYSVSEAGPVATLTVTRTGVNDTPATATVGTNGVGTATVVDDYTATSTVLNFGVGVSSLPFTVPITDDMVNEPSETFESAITLTTGQASIGTPNIATTTITDDDPIPTYTIDNVTLAEGNPVGTTSFDFTVTKVGATTQTHLVDFRVNDGTATVADNDYVDQCGTLTFLASETTKTISVLVNGDFADEPDETFTVELNAGCMMRPDGEGPMGGPSGTGTITNDDFPYPTFTVDDVTLNEGNTGTTSFDFTVTKVGMTNQVTEVGYTTMDGTATVMNNDYQPACGTLSFAVAETTKTVTVLVNGDTTFENDEAFTLQLQTPQPCRPALAPTEPVSERAVVNAAAQMDGYAVSIVPSVGTTTPGGSAPDGVGTCTSQPGLVIHDDGTMENGYTGNAAVVSLVHMVDKFTPTTYPATYSSVCVAFLNGAGTPTTLSYNVVAYDDDGAGGAPGTLLGTVAANATGIPAFPTVVWQSVDISSMALNVGSGSVYLGVNYVPQSPDNVFVGSDESIGNPVGFAGGYTAFDTITPPSVPFTTTESFFTGYRSMMVRAVEQPGRACV